MPAEVECENATHIDMRVGDRNDLANDVHKEIGRSLRLSTSNARPGLIANLNVSVVGSAPPHDRSKWLE